jgi:hypothetical protein
LSDEQYYAKVTGWRKKFTKNKLQITNLAVIIGFWVLGFGICDFILANPAPKNP